MTTLAETRPRLRGLWRHADFRRLWGAQTVSVFGDQISILALPLTGVLVLHASPFAMGVLTAAGWLPHLLLSLGAGAWIDRRQGRRDVMVAADVLRAAALVSVPLAYAFGVLTLPHLFVVAFVVGSLTVLFDLSSSSYFLVVVPRDAILEANSKMSTSRSASYIAGPSLAGVLVQALSGPVALLADAVSFIGSAALIRRMGAQEPPVEGAAGESLRRRLGVAARFLLGRPILRSILACATTLNLFNFILWGVLVLFLADELELSPGLIGAVFSAGAVGALVGALVAGRIGARIGIGRAVVVGSLVFPAPLVLFAFAGGPRWLVIAMLVTGEFLSSVGVMIFDINANSIQALLTPHALRARVGGFQRTINYGVRPLGALLGGVLGETIGLRPTVAVGTIGATLAFAVALFSPLRSLREVPEEAS